MKKVPIARLLVSEESRLAIGSARKTEKKWSVPEVELTV
jgi:hypothetical protein